MAEKFKLTDTEKFKLIEKAVEASMQNNLSNFDFVIIVSAIVHQEELSLSDLGWGTEELAEIRRPASERKCFSCQPGVEFGPVEFHEPRYKYDLCKFHADMGMVAGWKIIPIAAASKDS